MRKTSHMDPPDGLAINGIVLDARPRKNLPLKADSLSEERPSPQTCMRAGPPETWATLILSLRNAGDQVRGKSSWRHWPVVYRAARDEGFQAAERQK